MNSGIYKIVNNLNGNSYIGSAINFRARFDVHKSFLNNSKHHNRYLQNSWNKYGANNFSFIILAICPPEYLEKLEQWFVDNLNPKYNIRRLVVGSNLGVIRGSITRNKISNSLIGNENAVGATRTQEYCEKVRQNLLGHKVSRQTRNKIANSLRGTKQSQTTILKRAKKHCRKVRLIVNGEVKEYSSIKHAAQDRGISTTHIILCCQEKKKVVLESGSMYKGIYR